MNEVFSGALKTGNIAGAYLIEGASKESIMWQTDEFLLHLFCDDEKACRRCPGCVKYLNRSHADILMITSDEKTIKVDQVRDIAPFVYRKSFEGGWKAVVIPKADSMTPQAQNAILKVLEEPPKDTLFVLGAMDVRVLLPTVQSRCIQVRAQKSDGDIYKQLMEEFDLSTVKARTLLKVAGGDYYLAKKHAEQNYFAMREDMMLMVGRLLNARNMATSATEKLVFKYEKNIEDALTVAILFLRDVLTFKHTNNVALIANEDSLTEIKKHVRQPDLVLVNTLDTIADFLKECAVNPGMNKKLILTGMMFDILAVGLRERKLAQSI